ncbi:hypothetical protein BDW59DRAFT_171363 [Aspergillus cavernicola]|uniref:Zn(2)-C6 fungal-type domain-containing protein n=1 Tax=Aspergillus cavernicola TaxID=176166 RepID=A0ABR4IHT5_9EURO
MEGRKRHCWECLRRSLVCDFQVPGCKRCAASKTNCPGYGETPPVRVKWLAPGQVNSRQYKGKNRQKIGKARCESTRSESTADTQILAVPSFELQTEAHAQVQAFEYFNACIYPIQAQVLQLGTNRNVYKIPAAVFQRGLAAPDHIRLGLVYMMLSHRINQTAGHPDSKALAKTLYHYRGLMIHIHSLNDDISVTQKRASNMVLTGILVLLLADTQQGISQNWRYHIEGARRLIMLRGGIHQVAISYGALPMILSFIFLVVTADTSSPASNLLVQTLPIEELYSMLERYGGNGYAFQMCPTSLFVEIAKINYIRARASKSEMVEEGDLRKDACEALRRIYDFSFEEWANINGHLKEAHNLFFSILQSAVALYCISSLQTLGGLPPGSTLLLSNGYMEREILYGLLGKAFNPASAFRITGYLLWPLIVLGVQAVDGGADMRTFVRKSLTDLSAYWGTHSPLAAKEVLENF